MGAQNFAQAYPGVTPGPAAFAGAVPGMPGFPGPSSGVPTSTAATSQPSIRTNTELLDVFRLMKNAAEADAEKERQEKEKEKEREKKKKTKLEPLTVEDLLNIPLPKTEAKPKAIAKTKKEASSRSESPNTTQKPISETSSPQIEVAEDNQENVVVITQEEENGSMESMEVVEEQQVEITPEAEVPLVAEDKEAEGGEMEVEGEVDAEPAKVYHFAWDDAPDDLSDVTVSSVHTSDISSFEEDSHSDVGASDQDLEEKETAELSQSTTTEKVDGSSEDTADGGLTEDCLKISLFNLFSHHCRSTSGLYKCYIFNHIQGPHKVHFP